MSADRRSYGRRILGRAAAALLIASEPAGAQLFASDRTFSFYAENDALGGETDRSYTNGVRITWDFSVFSQTLGTIHRVTSLSWLLSTQARRTIVGDHCVPREGRDTRPCGTVSFGIGQTLYSPDDLLDTLPRPHERPYAGLMFASAALSTVYQRWHLGSELLVGVIGPWSHGESAQSLAHWSFSTPSAKPRGWRNQLHNAPVIALVNTYAVRPSFAELCLTKFGCNGGYGENRVFDVTPRGELALGTHMVRGSAGAIVRAGWRFPDVVGLARIPTTAAQDVGAAGAQPWFALFYAADARRVARNAFLTGTRADRGPGGWDTIRDISPSRGVTERAFGFTGGISSLAVTFQMVDRSREYTGDLAHHRFGALTVSLFTTGSSP